MSAPLHTPGPWVVERRGSSLGAMIMAAHRGPGSSFCVATVNAWEDGADAGFNSNLIAAAPEMLEALYQYVADLRYPPQGDSIQRRIERAEAVIAKARGGK